jgi:hypothetical protein
MESRDVERSGRAHQNHRDRRIADRFADLYFITKPLRFLISNHEGHEEYEEKQEVAIVCLREFRFFVVRRKSTYYMKSAKL